MRPWLIGAFVLLMIWQLTAGHYVFAAVVTVVVLGMVIRRRRRQLAHRDAGLRARADFEHRLTMAGDPRGMFGRYPPVQTFGQ